MAVVAAAILVSMPMSLCADLIVLNRQSRTVFDVGAAVGPQVDRFRQAPPDETALSGFYSHQYAYDAAADFSNGSVTGTALASGQYSHATSIDWNANFLDVIFSAGAAGEASRSGDGQAFADTTASFSLTFEVTQATDFEFDALIDPTAGDALSRFRLRELQTFTYLEDISLPGIYGGSGQLDPGRYRLIVLVSGSDLNEDDPFAAGLDLNFRVGQAVPEPAAIVLYAVLSGMGFVCIRHR